MVRLTGGLYQIIENICKYKGLQKLKHSGILRFVTNTPTLKVTYDEVYKGFSQPAE